MNALSEYRQGLKQKILAVSMNEFKLHGIKAVKMDDIAKKLSISKRTLYELYVDKETLLMECMKFNEDEFDSHMRDFVQLHDANVIQTIIEFFRYHIKSSKDVNPQFFTDLNKYEKVVNFLEERHQGRKDNEQAFFKKGIEQGFFRDDLDYEISVEMCSLAMNGMMRKQLYNTVDLYEVFRSFVLVFVRGFCTETGLEMLNNEFN